MEKVAGIVNVVEVVVIVSCIVKLEDAEVGK